MAVHDPSLQALLDNPASLSVTELRALNDRYPYFSLPAIMLLSEHADQLSEEEISRLKFHLAMITGDRESLFNMFGDKAAEFASIYPPERKPDVPSTESAIDTFFANYGSSDPSEVAIIERMIFNPVSTDYVDTLISEDQGVPAPAGSFESRIEAFVKDHSPEGASTLAPQPSQSPEVPPTVTPHSSVAQAAVAPPDDSLLSESLAKIFIKQGRYTRAYEIISNLSLNYPKKSIYFADQLRFLQKLIKIQQAQEANNS